MSWESHIEDLIAECSRSELKWIKDLCNKHLRDMKKRSDSMTIALDIVKEILKRHKKIAFIIDDSELYIIVEQDLKYLDKLKDLEVLDQISIVGIMDNDEFYRINLINDLDEINELEIVRDNYENKYIDYININKLTVYFKSSNVEDNISIVSDIYEMNYNLNEV